MITKDIKSYLFQNYADYYEAISELSQSDNGKVLVEDERMLFNFDKITKELYPQNKPESADAIYASDKKILLVEYKSGFKKKVNKADIGENGMTCYDNPDKYCRAYTDLFFKNQKNEDKILRNSIHFKAVESYMTLVEGIASKSNDDTNKQKQLIYCVVIDDYVESMEDILNDMAKKSSDTNVMQSIRQSLTRFRKNSRKDYYYDDIKVVSPHDFKIIVNDILK